ncbi:preATP grasp domain-containing protein [Amycolatopsis aidingensis]|uniref:preATP grasp domain-containing protein n=1 Tax=Amycolatopsis aidingensis TaxID=2842453 RepID=UPI001C0E6A27|nr:peptide ligase PGM1-related protein [Amycolatopsis aidingensis]
MSTVFVANNRTEQMVGDLGALPPEQRRFAGYTAQRMLWYVDEGDILVVPHAPSEPFSRYLTGLMDVDLDTVQILVPPPGQFGVDVLSADRIENKEFQDKLKSYVDKSYSSGVFPIIFDEVIARLTRRLGLADCTPGFGFFGQGGSNLLNSKSAFRALAGGTGCPIADGRVVRDMEAAESYLWELLSSGLCAIVKQDQHVGGFGNEIISPRDGVNPIGAPQVMTITERSALHELVTRRWPWYSGNNRRQVVIEHYIPDCTPVYIEMSITDDGVALFGHGEMLTKPIFNGLVIPAQSASHPAWPGFISATENLCQAIYGMGYRGLISIDGIVTPAGEILINEVNGRVGGSTHVTRLIQHLVGPQFLDERVVMQRHFWPVPSFDRALEALSNHDLAFDRSPRTGAVITSDDVTGGTVEYCLIGESFEHATELEERINELTFG